MQSIYLLVWSAAILKTFFFLLFNTHNRRRTINENESVEATAWPRRDGVGEVCFGLKSVHVSQRRRMGWSSRLPPPVCAAGGGFLPLADCHLTLLTRRCQRHSRWWVWCGVQWTYTHTHTHIHTHTHSHTHTHTPSDAQIYTGTHTYTWMQRKQADSDHGYSAQPLLWIKELRTVIAIQMLV